MVINASQETEFSRNLKLDLLVVRLHLFLDLLQLLLAHLRAVHPPELLDVQVLRFVQVLR